ncbi:MAG: hypothetical protein L0Z49_05270 [Actinobacteria bacterium]|nr:hypothetical protein [Actinomycetota bacterium]MCI0543842.1 hypothetical protein [Actinomycetota bacterium]
MPIYDGVITIEGDRVPVIVGVEPDRLRLSANGTEIGEWVAGEFKIDHRGDGVYTITADDETIEFVPNRPDLFAAGVGRGEAVERSRVADPEPEPVLGTGDDTVPPPQALTRALFYTLAGTTAALGLWALYRLLF